MIGRSAEQVVKVRIGPQHLPIATAVGLVDVHKRGVEPQGRHGEQGFAVIVGRADGLEFGVARLHVGGQACARGQKGQAHGGGAQSPLEHTLVDLGDLEVAGLAGATKVRIKSNDVEGDKAEHQPSHAPGGAQQADVGTAVAHQREVGERRAQYLAHQRHGLAAGAPAAYAQRHAVGELADDVSGRHRFLGHL